MPRRFQFSLRALLVTMLVVAVFFGGMSVQRHLDEPLLRYTAGYVDGETTRYVETITLSDGTEWSRELGGHLEQ
jgi:hypothetical protein